MDLCAFRYYMIYKCKCKRFPSVELLNERFFLKTAQGFVECRAAETARQIVLEFPYPVSRFSRGLLVHWYHPTDAGTLTVRLAHCRTRSRYSTCALRLDNGFVRGVRLPTRRCVFLASGVPTSQARAHAYTGAVHVLYRCEQCDIDLAIAHAPPTCSAVFKNRRRLANVSCLENLTKNTARRCIVKDC